VLISLPTYPDYAAVQRAKEEQSESVELLKKTGVQEFDLPVHWLPVDNGGEQSDHGGAGADAGRDAEVCDGCGGRNDDGGRDEIDASSSDSETEAGFRQRGWPSLRGRSANDRNLVSVREGKFAFFMAREAPFLIGRIVSESVGDEGERGVDIHWLRPTDNHTRDNAAFLTLQQYGKCSFVEGYILENVGDRNGRAGKEKRVKEVSWEPVEAIVATCDKLVGNGKKIPTRVLTVLEAAIGARDSVYSAREERRQSGEKGVEEDKENRDPSVIQARGASTGGAGGCMGSLSQAGVGGAVLSDADTGRSSNGVRKRPNPTTQMPQINTRIRLTAAHFRSRRGASEK